MSTLKKGKQGEMFAANYLLKEKYEILETNYRYGRGEIDIICKKDGTLIFVEVKYKTSSGFGFPELAVDSAKEEMVINTADHYIHENNWQGMIRFDIISILDINGKMDLNHFEDAFY